MNNKNVYDTPLRNIKMFTLPPLSIFHKVNTFSKELFYLCSPELNCGVMVALGILVPSVSVRIAAVQRIPRQASRLAFFVPPLAFMGDR